MVLASAANKSYPADPSVALTGSFAKTLSSKYLILICFGFFFFFQMKTGNKTMLALCKS